jgi:dipeptidyl-peptidase-4
MTDTFPRQYARTQRLTLGEPRNIVVSPDGKRVLFLRSPAGNDTVNSLWLCHTERNTETCIADIRVLLSGSKAENESAQERARRERAREGAAGIVSFSCDSDVHHAVFAVSGRLFLCDMHHAHEIVVNNPAPGTMYDARISPNGKHIAYVRGSALYVCDIQGNEKCLTPEIATDTTWGVAEFVAAEEMNRQRGYWWSPNSDALVVERVDNSPIDLITIADPSQPTAEPQTRRYPFAGTNNARTSLHVIDLEACSTNITWDAETFEYLASVQWNKAGLIMSVMSRDQKLLDIRKVYIATGESESLHVERDDKWVELVAGGPVLVTENSLLWCGERNGARAILLNNTAITPPHIQVRGIVNANAEHVTFSGNPLDQPQVLHAWRVNLANHELTQLTHDDGVHSVAIGGDTTVVRSATMHNPRSRTLVNNHHELANNAEQSLLNVNVSFHLVGKRNISTAIVLPENHDGSALPVLFDPYGGPHAQRVVASSMAFTAAQWFANQGFCVVIADGSGTPGRGSEWEREVYHDLATTVLNDQIDVLAHLHEIAPCADTSRVAIRGWSFGGYLAALAVIRAPQLFHAAVAGAPVTEWKLYDTFYTERYLGNPAHDEQPYIASSLLHDAKNLTRPLLIIHGLADDNVLAAHSLELTTALLHAGKPHEFLPLVGVTHMTPQEVVAENLLLHQLDFLRRSLSLR